MPDDVGKVLPQGTRAAFAIVRVSEGFLYSGVIADRAPDIGRAVTVIEPLLRGLDLVNRAPVPS
jgi:hypothetical protein